MEGMRRIGITDAVWGRVVVWRPIPDSESEWGVLSPLQGTVWGSRIPVVSGANMSHALHGHATPLMNQIGQDPEHIGKRFRDQICVMVSSCVNASPKCHPGGGKYLPDCYQAPGDSSDVSYLASFVVLCWRRGEYVVVVEGDEFSV